jgi:hypothetical protein
MHAMDKTNLRIVVLLEACAVETLEGEKRGQILRPGFIATTAPTIDRPPPR